MLLLTVAPIAVFAANGMTDGTGPVMEKTSAEEMKLNVGVGNNIDPHADLKTAQAFAGVLKRK